MINAKYAADERKVPITNAIRAALVIYLIVSVNPVFSHAREPDAKVDLSSDRPNIIFLFADDQRPDTISAYGNPHIRTPHLDQLARRGTSFRRNYCAGSFSGAVCVASRAML
ncbi:MAG: sulfatase-like hydrolase/transferase, partial [Planctomycetota bacterium]|nr:sulfatase-like hydrolase/transferase [Planctomycetota bacterium]